MHRKAWFCRRLTLPALALLAGAVTVTNAAASPPKLNKTVCWFDLPKDLAVDCFRLDVPETRSFDVSVGPGKTLSLPVVLVHSGAGEKQPDPVVYLAGGPGDGAWLDSERIGWWWDYVAANDWPKRRDLILFDQRGSGLVEPRIDCPEVERIALELLATNDPVRSADLQKDAAAACGKRLVADGFNPGAYTSRDGAADLHDLFQALGVKSWNVYGLSYGTRLALEYMRQYPQDIRSVLLDSVLPPEAQFLEDDAQSTQRAFAMVFNACARQEECHEAYGDLGARMTGLVEKLNRHPREIERPSPDGHGKVKIVLDGNLLVTRLFGLLYNRADIEILPQVIDQYDRNDQKAIAADLDAYIADAVGREDFGDAMFMSVHCQEEVPFNDMAKAVAAYRRYPMLTGLAAIGEAGSFAATCAAWRKYLPEEPLRESDTEPVASDLPTLILSGLFDPVTPPAYGRMASSHLVNSFFLEFDGLGHDLLGNDSCANVIAGKFFDDPAAPPRDSCLGEQRPPEFAMPSN